VTEAAKPQDGTVWVESKNRDLLDSGTRRSIGSKEAVIAAVAVIVAAIIGIIPALRDDSPTPPPPENSQISPPEAKPKCAVGALHVVGSTAFRPIALAAAKVYMQECSNVDIVVTGGDSAFGLTKLQEAVTAGSSSADLTIAMYDGSPSSSQTENLSAPHPMGAIILSIVAQRDSIPELNITTDRLRRIFLKPGEPGWVAVGRRAGSGTRAAFRKILGRDPGPPDKGNCPKPTGSSVSFRSCTQADTTDLLRFVDGTPNAIGYAALPPFSDYPKVSVIKLDGYGPSQQNVRDGTYKFWAVENLYTAPNPTALTKNFLEFLTHHRAANAPSYYVPCAEMSKSLKIDC
jgi:phosphate transport system substrate-binding protein